MNEDNEIIIDVLNGNINSFRLIIEKYQRKMYNLAFQIVNDKDSAKDITQDVFIKIFNHLKNFNSNKKFFSWIYRITLNETLNWKKKSTYLQPIDELHAAEYSNPSVDYEKNERAIQISKALNKLDEKYRTLLILKHYNDLSYDEIGEILELPTAKVKSRLYIAREKLRNLLGNYDNE